MILDPNVAYDAVQRAMHDLDVTRGDDESVVDAAIEAWHGLNTWLLRGGFTPSAWVEAQRRALENTTVPSTSASNLIDDIQANLRSNPWRQ